MLKLKYLLILIISIALFNKAEALDIQYGTIISTKGSDILVQYYGIEKKQNFICSTVTTKCSPTKKVTLGIPPTNTIPQSLRTELEEKHANHITLSPSKELLAYYIGGTDELPGRTFTIRNIATKKEYTVSSSVSYWDLVEDEGRVFAFSPDSKKLAYLDDREGQLSLYLVDTTKLDGETISSTKLPTTAFQIDDFIFSDNDTLYYVGNTKDNNYKWSLYRYNMKTGKDLILDSFVSYTDPLIKIGGSIVYNHLQKNGYSPKMYNLATKKVLQFKTPYVSTNKAIDTQEIVKIGQSQGILMKPKKEDSKEGYPLIIWLHGGPYRQTSYGYHPFHSYGIYDGILSLLQKNNVVILKLDYRGSLGFGRAYAEGIKGNVGKGDVDDVMSAIAYAQKRYNIKNVYLAGNSYGGYLSLSTLAQYPQGLSGIISINGVTDWESLLVKMKTSIFNTEFNGLPTESNRALYDQASIYNKISNIGDQKIKIIAGEADRTIPIWQATDLYLKLKEQNKNVSIVEYRGEDHVYKEKKTIQDLCGQMFDFVGLLIDKECKS
jgi:dipeptidyl aminopeptidase/acylaminoacyl peptidase